MDVIVIGGGPAAENVVGRCADGGLEVALIERELVGGECSYWGCIPSKTLIRPGDALAAARRVPGAAEALTGTVDAVRAFAQRDYMVNNWTDRGQADWLAERSVQLFRGHGRLVGDRVVDVEGDGTTVTLRARRAVVLATGSGPVIPPIDGLREIQPWDNRDATAAKELPRRLLVLGGGAVGVEMAQAFKRLGSEEVTIVEALERLLANEEPFAGNELEAAFTSEGIVVVTGARLTAARRERSHGAVVASLDDGRELNADEILVAVGRRPNTANLGLDEVDMAEAAGRYLDVDDRLRVRGVDGDWLYAVGDCNGRALLTHMGKYQGRLCADAILGKDVSDVADHGIVPRVTFTDPQVCAVGLTEKQARDQGLHPRVITYGTGDVAGAYTLGNGVSGTSQLVVDDGRQVIVGATFTGPGIQELLHSATIAIAGAVTLDRLWHAVPAFPTVSEVWLRLLEAYGL